MGLEGKQVLLKKMTNDDQEEEAQHWLAMADDNGNVSDQSRYSESSFMEDSTNSTTSCSSSELAEDATSSSSSSSSSLLLADRANGPLYELSQLMAELPIKRGLSKFYEGKSQSHTSLASVRTLEDLAKKGNHHKIKMKSSRSYAWGLDVQKTCISKNKSSRGSALSSLGKKAGSFVAVSSGDRLRT